MSQAETEELTANQKEARRALVFPILVWGSQLLALVMNSVTRDAFIVLVGSVTLAAFQLLFLWRGVFHGFRSLARRTPNEPLVLAPAIMGLTISLSTFGLIVVFTARAILLNRI